MKNRILSAILLVCILMLSSCGIIFGDVADEGSVTVVVENADGSYDTWDAELVNVENKDEGAEGILEYLAGRENAPIYLEMVDSSYGAYVSAVGSIKEDYTTAVYVIVYTSVQADSYVGAPTVDYNGTTLYMAGVGLSGMSVEAGTVILFRAEKSPY